MTTAIPPFLDTKLATVVIINAGLASGIYRRYLLVNTGMDNTPKSGVYRHL